MAEKRKLAFYIRLSDADEEVKAGTKDESNSITGQRKLLYAYIKKTEEFAGFEVLEYFDDGYSGTMFNNRAEFQRLIQDAELGRFECIIVKDFSRFGRDYLEVGNYLEFVFPAMGMRFISVNDNYDSDRNFGVTGGMDVAYKNLIYQLYSMDLSRKVKSALGKVGAIILCLVDLFAGAFMPKSVPNFLAPSEIVVICIFALLVLLVYSCKIKIQGVYLSNDLRSKISNFKVNTPNNK